MTQTDSSELLCINAEIDVHFSLATWCCRVPTLSNPSDDASRLRFEKYREWGACWTGRQYDLLHKFGRWGVEARRTGLAL